MARADTRQYFSGFRFLVRVRPSMREWVMLPVARVTSTAEGLMLSSGASPEHPLYKALTSDEKGFIPTQLEVWRAARGTPEHEAVVVCEAYTFEGFLPRPYTLDAGSNDVPLEHAVLKGLVKTGTQTILAKDVSPSLPPAIQGLARSVLTAVPKEPGDYEVYFAREGSEFSYDGSRCPLKVETIESAGLPAQYRVVFNTAGVELPSTGNTRLDRAQRRGGETHDGEVYQCVGDDLDHTVAEALYQLRMRVGRVIESVVKS